MRIKNFRLREGFSTIFLLVIAAVVALGLLALVVVKNVNLKKVSPVPIAEQDEQVRKLDTQSNSDEVGAIEKDVNDTSFDNLDQGTDQIQKDIAGVQ